MISLDYCRTFVRYDRWQNERLLALCDALSDEERKRDTGAPFQSIHGILNHMLVGDRLWLGRFTGVPFTGATSLSQELYSDWSELRAARAETDAVAEAWVAGLTTEVLASDITFTLMSRPVTMTVPLWFTVVQFFNHHTHHRGQLGVLLEQAGCDIGTTDIFALPDGPTVTG